MGVTRDFTETMTVRKPGTERELNIEFLDRLKADLDFAMNEGVFIGALDTVVNAISHINYRIGEMVEKRIALEKAENDGSPETAP